MKRFVYADNAATTQLNMKAYEAMRPFFESEYGNASQPYSFSRSAKAALKTARETIADCIHAKPSEIYFTSGGTESDNWAIKGTAFLFGKNKKILTSQIEHHAVLKSCAFLENQGYEVEYLPVDSEGVVLLEEYEKACTQNVGLVSIMLANNEIGTVEPIKKLAQIAHKKGVLFHTDAVQAVGHLSVDVKDLDVDFLSVSAHKFGGPKGIGFLYIKDGIDILPYLNGGAQENGHRAGTENIASIVGMAVALKESCFQYAMIEERYAFLKHIRRCFSLEFARYGIVEGSDYIFNGGDSNCLPGLVSISFKDKDGEQIMHRLDFKGIMISTGAACDSVKTEVSHVIKAIKTPHNYAEGTIRISLNTNNSKDDIKTIVEAIISIIRDTEN